MTDSQKNIIDDLKFIGHCFENISIRYEYQDFSKSHLIEILPSELFEDEMYNDLEWDIKERFHQINNGESLVFFTKGQLVSLTEKNILYRHSRDTISEAFYTRSHHLPIFNTDAKREFFWHPNSIVIDYNDYLNSYLNFDTEQFRKPLLLASTVVSRAREYLSDLELKEPKHNDNLTQARRTPNVDTTMNCLV